MHGVSIIYIYTHMLAPSEMDVSQYAEQCWFIQFHHFILENAVCDPLAYFSDLQVSHELQLGKPTLQVRACECGLTDRKPWQGLRALPFYHEAYCLLSNAGSRTDGTSSVPHL